MRPLYIFHASIASTLLILLVVACPMAPTIELDLSLPSELQSMISSTSDLETIGTRNLVGSVIEQLSDGRLNQVATARNSDDVQSEYLDPPREVFTKYFSCSSAANASILSGAIGASSESIVEVKVLLIEKGEIAQNKIDQTKRLERRFKSEKQQGGT